MAADTSDRVKRITVRMLKFGADAPSSSNDNNYSNTHLTSEIESTWHLYFKPKFIAAGWDVGSTDYPTADISSEAAENKEINEAIAQVVAYTLLQEAPEVDMRAYAPGSEIWTKRKHALAWLGLVSTGQRVFDGIDRISGDLPDGPIIDDPPILFGDRDDGEDNEDNEDERTRLDGG